MKYSFEHIIPPGVVTKEGNVAPSHVLSVFQQAATDHAEILGVGFDALLEKGLLWVVTQVKYQVMGDIREGDALTVTTWPLPHNRLGFERDYRVCSKTGEVLIKGVSNWALMDADTRRLAMPFAVYPGTDFCMDRNFEDRPKRLRDFEAEGPGCTLVPDESYIDRNGHVNNTRYADLAAAALGGFAGRIDTFQMDYLHEVMHGEAVTLHFTPIDGGIRLKGEDETGLRKFACSVIYR